MALKLSDLERQVSLNKNELVRYANVVTPYAGQVVELKVLPGATITENTAILTIQPFTQALEGVVYLPSSDVKDVHIGQEAQVSPSNVKREEYGYLRGTVTFVADYPATTATIMRNFQNESLASSLTADKAPVTEVRVRLSRDPATPTGFLWSSSKGPEEHISSGSICTVDIVTREQPPIALVVPSLKNILGLK
jgi:HlyD family secretion protein